MAVQRGSHTSTRTGRYTTTAVRVTERYAMSAFGGASGNTIESNNVFNHANVTNRSCLLLCRLGEALGEAGEARHRPWLLS